MTSLRNNWKILLILLILVPTIFFVTVLFEKFNIEKIKNDSNLIDPKFDIVNPSFTINNDEEKISVTAAKGNFMSKNLILL